MSDALRALAASITARAKEASKQRTRWGGRPHLSMYTKAAAHYAYRSQGMKKCKRCKQPL